VTMIAYSRSLPIRHDVDVFVAGGGPAGVAAALAAARNGASVFAAEGTACFGGMGTSGLVPAFMQFADGEHFLAGGIGREVYDRLWEAKGAGPDDRYDSPMALLSIRAEVLKRVYDDLMEASGARYALMTQMVDVIASDGTVDAVVCSGKSGLYAVRARIYVDATGDGDLAAWAGAAYEKGDAEGKMMAGTLCSLWAGVDWDAVRAANQRAGDELPRAFEDGIFSIQDRHLPGMWRVGQTLAGGNIGHTFGVDGTDERSLTEALVYGRKLLTEYERFYRRYLAGYARMELAATGALLGIRETRRIVGDYQLNLNDFQARAVFADEIGRYAYPVDIHASDPSAETHAKFMEAFQSLRLNPGESYGIPYRTLTPKGLSNVLVAGRCISTDRAVQGSVRVMPGCYITGQAAGVAAALASRKDLDVHAVDVTEVQGRLKEMGAYLPNA
ncbi:MAG: FAD-dependent oxidoreductase, partial [Anaerolineae bacterium]|nr:FAD-dependent oxidoreductase [Anaerolineae bacterium]